MPAGVSYVVFDDAVNSGVSQLVKWLQQTLGVAADSVLGPAALGAIKAYPSHDRLVDAICHCRLAFLKVLKTWKTFGKGWAARVAGV